MRKNLTLVLVALMAMAMLCACTPAQNTTTTGGEGTTTTADTTPGTTESNGSSEESTVPAESNGPEVVKVSDYFADESKWDDDGGYFTLDAEKIFFDNFAAGDYAAVRLNEQHQNVTYQFTVTLNKLAPVSMDDWTWWDSEFLVIARSTQAGSSWQDDGSQIGYTLTSWGDMSTVFIGRCGYDDAFGEFEWNINDGKPHDIELTVVNNEDNTAVTVTLVVDGTEIAQIVDDGSKVKNERPSLYPDAGGLTIRCKWLEAVIE